MLYRVHLGWAGFKLTALVEIGIQLPYNHDHDAHYGMGGGVSDYCKPVLVISISAILHTSCKATNNHEIVQWIPRLHLITLVLFFYQILQKEILNCDGHQYQPNEQSPLILSDLTEHKSDHNIWTITSHLIWSHWTQIRPQDMNNHLSSYLISLNTNQTTTYDVGNLGPGLGRAQKCGGIKQVNGIPTLPSW